MLKKRLQRRDVALWQFCQLSRVCFAALSFQFSCMYNSVASSTVFKNRPESRIWPIFQCCERSELKNEENQNKKARKFKNALKNSYEIFSRIFKQCDARVLCSWMSNDIGKTFYWRKQSLVGQWRPTKSPWSNISWNEDGGVALEGCYKSLLLSKQL